MIHSATLVHDDVLDSSDMRRGRPSVTSTYGSRQATLTGSYILTSSSQLLAQIDNPDVISVLSRVLDDLLRGETLQLIQLDDEDRRFKVYFEKTYGKTASLIANGCKAVAMLSNPQDTSLVESAYQFGRNLGMAFQLIDDVLDLSCKGDALGKPSGGADLSLGIVTAPVLFASQQFDEVAAAISRNFSRPNDVPLVLDYIAKSDGLEQTRMLAEFHFQEAQRQILRIQDSPYRQALLHVAAKFIQRDR
ncbi:Decaprenyl-diphosphate synthase subunit 1 [Cichlidogyrus casuarinus]|uniref:Decaprenyl-diphosphate synthase subunit 1 n=1 Tax=Cichlidogyrus casuarinus TaxID=1844966 RepID=A0ABD2QH28_9PLAT